MNQNSLSSQMGSQWGSQLAAIGFSAIAMSLCFSLPVPLSGQEMTVRIQSKNRSYEGKPLAYDGSNMVLMRRDGRISILDVAGSEDIETVSNRFVPHKSSDMRARLQKEFGRKYQISLTRNFVVVHPPGNFQNWASPFETLYQRFRVYFSSRGFQIDEPEFPLVAVVLRTRREFDKFLTLYHQYDSRTLGYYSQKSNRIITFDPTAGRGAAKDWMFNATLVHETVHQTAFNTGVHRRFGFTPKWVLEGLACMFEAKGVHNSMNHSELADRINTERLALLRHYYNGDRIQGRLKSVIGSDELFDQDPSVAYAYAWGLTFFLAEKYPAEFFLFLKLDAGREEFFEYMPDQRTRAFQQAFGDDLAGLEKRLERFIRDLPD